MPAKSIDLPRIGVVIFQKIANAKSIKIHINGSKVKVTLPSRIPYIVAKKFVESRTDWILSNIQTKPTLTDGTLVGKKHYIKIRHRPINRAVSRITEDTIVISLPEIHKVENNEVQNKIQKACEKALLLETELLVVPRLYDLAYEHQFALKTVSVKKLTSRWGSCDRSGNIKINSYLVQLPWELIDYVLLHELCHTKQMNHSKKFWQLTESILPNYKNLRKQIKQYSPHLVVS